MPDQESQYSIGHQKPNLSKEVDLIRSFFIPSITSDISLIEPSNT